MTPPLHYTDGRYGRTPPCFYLNGKINKAFATNLNYRYMTVYRCWYSKAEIQPLRYLTCALYSRRTRQEDSLARHELLVCDKMIASPTMFSPSQLWNLSLPTPSLSRQDMRRAARLNERRHLTVNKYPMSCHENGIHTLWQSVFVSCPASRLASNSQHTPNAPATSYYVPQHRRASTATKHRADPRPSFTLKLSSRFA